MSKPDAADCIPSGSASVPGSPAVQVTFAGYNREGFGYFYYIGYHEELIAAGVATEQMLSPGLPGRRRLDADGDRFAVNRRELHGQRRYTVMRVKRPDRVPGGIDAIAAWTARETWMDARSGFAGPQTPLPEPPEQPRRPPYLRLVVDNTREMRS